MKIRLKWDIHWFLLVASLLFLIFAPLSHEINFMQNDDWNRYKTVEAFMSGDYHLLDVTATTFYTQGFIGLIFSKLFSLQQLPYLTLMFGCLNFYLFARILYRFFRQNRVNSVLLAMLLFFNPIHVYSLLGFMTENYLLAFCLASIYFYLNSYGGKRLLRFILANFMWIAGFFSKQWAVVLPAAYFGELFFQKKFKPAFIQIFLLLAIVVYYFYFFPKTHEMLQQKNFEMHNFTSFKYMFTQAYAYFIYLAIFSFPVLWSFVRTELAKLDGKQKFFVYVFAFVLTILVKILFYKTTYPWKEFPLYPNIFTDKGFFLIGMEGEAKTNIYSELIYMLDEIGLFSLSMVAIIFLFREWSWNELFPKNARSKIFNFEFIAIIVGYFLMVGTPFVFDRYILVFVPLAILWLLRLNNYKFSVPILAVFLAIQTFISIDYAIEYVDRQQLIWNKSVEIHKKENIPENRIVSNHAWNAYYQVNFDNAVYWFRYSNHLLNPNEKVASEFWSRGIFTKTNIDIVRIQNR